MATMEITIDEEKMNHLIFQGKKSRSRVTKIRPLPPSVYCPQFHNKGYREKL